MKSISTRGSRCRLININGPMFLDEWKLEIHSWRLERASLRACSLLGATE